MTERKYLYEAKTATGAGKSGHVVAESVGDARERLALDGFADVVVHDDDFLSALRDSGEKQTGLPQQADLELLLRRDPSALGMSLYVVRKNWVMLAVVVAIVAAIAWYGVAWWVWAIVIPINAYLVYLMLFPGWLQWQQNEMHRRFWAADWDGAERIARRLRALEVVKNLPDAALDLDARIGGCLVKKGDVAGGYALLAPWEGEARLGKGIFLVKMNSLHFLARDWAKSLATHERILAETGTDTAKIDMALMQARLGDDDARALRLLDEIDAKNLVPVQAAFIAWAVGVVQLKRGENEPALATLASSVSGMQEFSVNPLTWGAVGLATGYLCVAMARTGRRKEAATLLASVRSIVERHGEDLLIAMLRGERLLDA